jgi:hypothetical protein
MRKLFAFLTLLMMLFSLTACGGQQGELVDMESVIVEDIGRGVIWDGRTYVPFCAVSKSDCGKQIGYVDGNTDDRISEYKGYSMDEWLVSWMPMDGGAMLLKEQSVVDIPDGLEAEY